MFEGLIPMTTERQLTHIDDEGRLRMVDVSEKDSTERIARARARMRLSEPTLAAVLDGKVPKGNVFEAARLAGIMGAKRTWELIPLCHPIRLTAVAIDFHVDRSAGMILIEAEVKTCDRTGVEMEALMAVTQAGLTIYDMCKAMDREMCIGDIELTFKSGGRSGTYSRA